MHPTRLRLLKIAEYTSLTASVVGVVISAVSRQVVYAAAPLSLSLFLNLINRQRFEQQTQQSLTAVATQFDQQLSHLNQSFLRLQQEVNSGLSQQSELSSRVTSFQQVRLDLSDTVTRVEERLLHLTQSVSDDIYSVRQQIQSQASVLDSVAPQGVQQKLSGLQNRINSIESLNLGLIPQNVAKLQSQYDSLVVSAFGVNQRLDSFPSIERVNNLQVEVDQLQAELDLVQTGLQRQQDSLQAAITQLQTVQALLNQFPSAFQPSEIETLPIQPPSLVKDDEIFPILTDLLDDNAGDFEVDREPELELLDLNLGIDFGTSFTKVCFRDVAQDRSEVVTFADGQATLNEALLPTKIGILADGTILAGLTTAEWEAFEQPIQTSVEFIKMRLADLDLQKSDGWRLEHLPELDDPETVENLCAYYLSRVITRAQSWIRRHQSDLIENQKIEWSANVGVPVAYCDSPSISRFEKVLSLAWLLSNEPQTERFTIQKLGDRLRQLSYLLSNVPIDCHAIPEISAAVWSFLSSREAREGFYAFFDVGCGTLDGVSFRYWREDGEPKVDFYSGMVKPLGVSALSQRLASELKAPETEIRKVIFNQGNSRLPKMDSSQSRKQVQLLVGGVVMGGRQKHGMHRPVFQNSEFQHGLPIFIGGGGGKTDFYKQAIMSTHADFQHKNAGIPAYIQKDIPTPKDLGMGSLNRKEFYRFAVAYGLSIPKGDCPDVKLPSEMANAEPQALKTTSGSTPVPYEDTRDSC